MDLATNRRLTKAFIDFLPTELTLIPRARVKKPAGGYAWEEQAPRAPQTFTIIEGGGIGALPRPTITADGVERVVEFQLLGEWNAELARGDVFTHKGKEWEVVDLFHDNEYERRALVSARG
jgi:hypothetical protein